MISHASALVLVASMIGNITAFGIQACALLREVKLPQTSRWVAVAATVGYWAVVCESGTIVYANTARDPIHMILFTCMVGTISIFSLLLATWSRHCGDSCF